MKPQSFASAVLGKAAPSFAFIFFAASSFAQAPNAILFIGDGMGPAQVTAARIYQGNARDGKLTLDTFDHVAMVRTYCANNMVTDSAAAGTALACGKKTNTAVVAQGPKGERFETILERAKREGKSVGVVTTTTLTHATPACFYAHVGLRADEAMIARQFMDYGQVDVALGGGREYFLPKETIDEENGEPGSRRDGANLIEEAKAKGYRVIHRQSEFDEVAAEVAKEGSAAPKLLGLFNHGHLSYELDRAGDKWGEPSLAQMTELAIKILRKNPKGYFLMVEGGKIDHAGHGNDARKMLTDLIAFDQAIKVGLDSQPAAPDTLIIVTADHETGGLAINGYPAITISGDELITRGRGVGPGDILSFASGPGGDRSKYEGMGKTEPGYKQPSLVLVSSAMHTGVDVIGWGSGPGSQAIKGTIDNTDVAKIIWRNLGFGEIEP